MSKTNKEIWDQLSNFVSVTPKQYFDALLALYEKLKEKDIKWIINGDLAERLRIVKVEPDCIEIVSSSEDAQKIYQAVENFAPRKISFQTIKLSRNAVVDGKEFPVYIRCFYFDFSLKNVKVRVEGDLQYKVGEWGWGDVFDFTPDYVYVVGKKIAVTPLSIASELYCSLGWIDRVEKIREVTQKLHASKIKPSLD
ncbi:MAG TPA: hypothetical protein VLU95_06285 [Candidatus Acidoferrum sp.]|nr:hypothetical protein [Candidatus Acidoferrum sp.]